MCRRGIYSTFSRDHLPEEVDAVYYPFLFTAQNQRQNMIREVATVKARLNNVKD